MLPELTVSCREETKGRFRKRAVLANVPSIRLLVQGNIRMYPRPGFGTGEHPNIRSFRLLVMGNIWMYPRPGFGTGDIRMYPRSGFWYREHLPKPPFWKPPFCEPPNLWHKCTSDFTGILLPNYFLVALVLFSEILLGPMFLLSLLIRVSKLCPWKKCTASILISQQNSLWIMLWKAPFPFHTSFHWTILGEWLVQSKQLPGYLKKWPYKLNLTSKKLNMTIWAYYTVYSWRGGWKEPQLSEVKHNLKRFQGPAQDRWCRAKLVWCRIA